METTEAAAEVLMKTNVWMPLYIGEYLGDTMHLSTVEHGAYLLLIMAYWRRQGPLSDDDQDLAAIAKLSQSDWFAIRLRIAKFFQIDRGLWHHKRIDHELALASDRKEARSKAGKLGNETRWRKTSQCDDFATGNGIANTIAKDRSSPSPSHISLERESADKPSLDEVLFYAQAIGLAEWKARDWFQEMEGCGWLDHNHRPIAKWQAVLDRVRTKWEADGRPSQPPTNHAGNQRHSKQNPRNAGFAVNPTEFGKQIAAVVAKQQQITSEKTL